MDAKTLPLFEPEPSRDRAPGGSPPDAHLRAVRRLCRDIRRTRPRSPQQTRTGQLICRHLVAMLRGAEAPPAPRRDV